MLNNLPALAGRLGRVGLAVLLAAPLGLGLPYALVSGDVVTQRQGQLLILLLLWPSIKLALWLCGRLGLPVSARGLPVLRCGCAPAVVFFAFVALVATIAAGLGYSLANPWPTLALSWAGLLGAILLAASAGLAEAWPPDRESGLQ